MVEFVPDVELVEVLFVPALLAVDVELLPVVEVEFPEAEPVVLDVAELFMPEVAPGVVLVVVLPALLPELLVRAPPGRAVTEPRLVPVVLDVLFALLGVLLKALFDMLLVVFVPAEVDVLLVTLKGAAAALPNESAASMSTLPAAMVDGTVTVVEMLPELVAVVLAGCAV